MGKNGALLVLLHGYGSNGGVMLALGQTLKVLLPELALFAPQGQRAERGGYCWFPISSAEDAELYAGAVQAGTALNRAIDERLARLGLEQHQLVLAGFSQGAIMALHVGLRRAVAPAAILGYSGLLAGRDRRAEITARPPVCLVHGELDPIVPVKAQALSAAALRQAGVSVDCHVLPRTGHVVGPQGLQLGLQFLRRVV